MTALDLLTLWDFSDPAGSEARFRARLAVATSRAHRLEVQTQIARAMGLQRRFDEALALLDSLRPELGRLEPDDPDAPRAAVRWFLEHGRCLASAIHRDHPGRALRDYTAAYDRALAAGEDALAADAAHMAAIVTEGSASDAWTERGLAVAERSSERTARNWRGTLLNNRGMNRHEQGLYAEALVDFEAALQARLEQGEPDRVHVARWMVAWTLRSLGRHDEALAILEQLVATPGPWGDEDPYVHEELAANLAALDRAGEAAEAEARAAALRAPNATATSAGA